ncbi:hypothetical protein [Runella sp.]|uniref:hypothetical protein n=1 Tax=Runella sp. TaxID=1960881 RepID=UPI0030159B0B
MKKIYSSLKYKKRQRRRERKLLYRRLVSKFKKKLKRIRRQGKSREALREERVMSDFNKVTAPENFSFIKNPEETINFINKIEELYLNKKNVFINIKDLKFLDYSAVTILVSVMFSFKSRRLKFNGNFPSNPKLAKLLIDSDFFKYLDKPIGDKIEYEIGKENQIFTRANKEVNSELGLVVMVEASTTIWGTQRTCKGLQRTLLELMQNTNNHADINKKGEKHWWLSVNHDKVNKKVSFIFVDYGVGIFESLKNKPQSNKWYGWVEKIKNKLVYGGNDEIFKMLLEGQMHLTVTGEHFRGKGLPGINEVLGRNQISNLKIVSNDVFADVQLKKYFKLKSEFSGTFVYWELNENNVNEKWII